MPRGGNSTERGMGYAHQQERKRWVKIVAAGDALCTRCRKIIPAWMAETQLWHLDHNDDRTGYLGAAHATCNTKAGAIKGNRLRGLRRAAVAKVVRSREW